MKLRKSLLIGIALLIAALILGSTVCYAGEVITIRDKKAGYEYQLTLPDAPQGLRVDSVSMNSVKVSWSGWNMGYYDGFDIGIINSSGKFTHKAYAKDKYEHCIKKLKRDKKYTIAVRGYVLDARGKKHFGKAAKIKAATAGKAPSIKSVKAKGVGTASLRWKKRSGVGGYIIQYSTSKKFADQYTCTLIVKGNKTSKKEIGGLANKKYYLRVASYRVAGGRRFASKWSKAKTVTIKKGASLRQMINYTKTDLKGRDAILKETNNGVDIKKYSSTYDRLKAIYSWHAEHSQEFANCVECNAHFNLCVDQLYGDKRAYDNFIWLAADNFENNDGSVVMHKWSVLFISGVKLIFDPRLQGYTGNYSGDTYFGITFSSPVGKHYHFDYWYCCWREQEYNENRIVYSK